MPTKKRSMHGAKPSSLPISAHAGIHAELRRQSEEMARTQGGPSVNGGLTHPRASFDGIMVPENPFQDPTFSASLQDLLPIDLSSRATPDSASTGGSSNRQRLNGLNKLDSLMFPSDDPFAYPNQPMMGLGFKRPARGGQAQESAYLIPGSFDDIDGQLLGQVPPYLMQEQGQPNLGMSGHGYAPGMMGLPTRTATHGAQVRRAQMQRQHDREIEHFLAQQNYQTEWSGPVFPRGSFSGL